jgi:hypothetical protein
MRKIGMLMGILSAALVTASVNAKPMTYGCDTAADRFSALEQQVDLKTFTLSTQIQPNEFRKGEYAPLAQIYLESADEKNRWAVKLIAPGHKAKAALVYLERTENGKDDEPFPIGAVQLGDKLTISLKVSDGKKISFKIGDLDGSPEMDLGETGKLAVICSTGDFVFSDLEWSEK